MPDADQQLKSDSGNRRRTSTRLSAMGLASLVRASSRDVPDRIADVVEREVIAGGQTLERSDITESKAGTPLMLILAIVEAANGFRPIAGAAVEIWHCDADGIYSEYGSRIDLESAATTYLRGVQTADEAGRVTFKTIYPGWCGSRATHLYLRIRDGARPVEIVQIGFPDAVNTAVHGDTALYVKGQNPTQNAADPVFHAVARNGSYGGRFDCQIVPVAGNNANGYVAMVEIPLNRFC